MMPSCILQPKPYTRFSMQIEHPDSGDRRLVPLSLTSISVETLEIWKVTTANPRVARSATAADLAASYQLGPARYRYQAIIIVPA